MHLIKSLKQSNRDIRILWSSVFFRMASYGLTNQVLTLYLEALHISPQRIGWFMTLTLVGDAVISYFLTWYADRIGRRLVMIIGTVMMLGSGLVFAGCSNYFILLAAAVLGVISSSGDETGPFKSVEEASIAHLTPDNHMPEIFAFHGLFSTAGAALGSLVSGALVDFLHLRMGYSMVKCYRLVFVVYSGFALVKMVLMLFLTDKCEIKEINGYEEISQNDGIEINEQENDGDIGTNVATGVLGSISPLTRYYLPRLLVIFMLDSMGYGFMPSAWVVYYLKKQFALNATTLGVLFFCANGFISVSSLPSAWVAKVLGPVRAILSTQAPSAVFFITIAYLDRFVVVAIFLSLYYITSVMDVVPRQVLLASLMPKQDLTRVMGIVNIGKTFARCIGPVFTGELASHGHLRYGFVINGMCVLMADLVMAINFLHVDYEILERQKVDNAID